MTPITMNSLVSESITQGDVKEYSITIPTTAKYVVQMGGTANVLFGIWQGDFIPADGELRICGVGCRGCRTLNSAAHVIRVTGNTAGPFTFEIRPWSFWDYFTIKFYGSTC